MAKAETKSEAVSIAPAKLLTAELSITGTAPLVQNKFSKKALEMMMATQAAGSQGKKGRKKEAKDFDAAFTAAQHVSEEGWYGIPAPAFRSAMISACRLCGFQMTKAKLSVFVEADGIDKDDGTPLVKLDAGEPEMHTAMVRVGMGVADVRARPMWRRWAAKLRVTYDADLFSISDVTNLLARAGQQVGIGEGRPDSKSSNGQGWGTFRLVSSR